MKSATGLLGKTFKPAKKHAKTSQSTANGQKCFPCWATIPPPPPPPPHHHHHPLLPLLPLLFLLLLLLHHHHHHHRLLVTPNDFTTPHLIFPPASGAGTGAGAGGSGRWASAAVACSRNSSGSRCRWGYAQHMEPENHWIVEEIFSSSMVHAIRFHVKFPRRSRSGSVLRKVAGSTSCACVEKQCC